MAIAAQTSAARNTLLGKLENATKQLRALESQNHLLVQKGPDVDAYLQAAADALVAAGYATANP